MGKLCPKFPIKNQAMPVGRPTIMTPVVVAKLEQAFAFGCTDVEACLFAGISKDCLYDYQTKHPEFVHRKEELKESPVLLARQSVIKHMEEDGDLAMKFLERRRKDEFSPKTEIENSGSINITKVERVIVDSQNPDTAHLPAATEPKPL